MPGPPGASVLTVTSGRVQWWGPPPMAGLLPGFCASSQAGTLPSTPSRSTGVGVHVCERAGTRVRACACARVLGVRPAAPPKGVCGGPSASGPRLRLLLHDQRPKEVRGAQESIPGSPCGGRVARLSAGLEEAERPPAGFVWGSGWVGGMAAFTWDRPRRGQPGLNC